MTMVDSEGSSVTLLVADDSDSVRKAIVHVLQGTPGIQIVAEARSFAQTIELTSKLHPRIVLLDIHMSDGDVVTPEQIKSALMDSCVVAMSIWVDRETKSLAEAMGAFLFLDKTKLALELIPAIRRCTQPSSKT